ncbi:cyclic di-GMP binding protein [Spirochaetia bacterium]|nr:cyclic di-GMP binding protein [Spirochaetia bacterium]
MGVLTSQKVSALYTQFSRTELVFTKEIVQGTGLVTQQIALKSQGDLFPCVIYSSSLQGARVLTNAKAQLIQNLQESNNLVSLRFCFKKEEDNPITFFVSTRSVGYAPYTGSPDTAMFTLEFIQRPPDDLIEIMGRIMEANETAVKKSRERIIINESTQKRLSISSKDTAVFIQGVPRRCMLRELSFSGAKVIMMGIAKFLVNKEAGIKIEFESPHEGFFIRGKFSSSEAVDGRKDLVALAIRFTDANVPIAYKLRISEYINAYRVEDRMEQATTKADQLASIGARINGTAQTDIKPVW